MNKPIVYILEGDPVPLARCRVSKYHNRVYDPQKQLKLVSQITLRTQREKHKQPLYTGPLAVEMYFYFHIPKTNLKTKSGDFKISTPDSDNLNKMIFDLGNDGILWKDDAIIVIGYYIKRYSDNPRTEFVITELGDYEEKEKPLYLFKKWQRNTTTL